MIKNREPNTTKGHVRHLVQITQNGNHAGHTETMDRSQCRFFNLFGKYRGHTPHVPQQIPSLLLTKEKIKTQMRFFAIGIWAGHGKENHF